jgi:hypothetical protein
MIAEVKGARLLQGFRGRPAADIEALEDTLVRVPSALPGMAPKGRTRRFDRDSANDRNRRN